MKTLLISIKKNDKIIIKIITDEKIFSLASQSEKIKTQQILPLIEKILKNHQIKIREIKRIEAYFDSNSFTSLRIGATIVNSIGWTLDIPVNNEDNSHILLPNYT